MRGLTYTASMGCAIVLLGAADARSENADEKQLQGKWIVESFRYNGNPVDRLKQAVREFHDGKYSLTPKTGEAIEGSVKLDTTKTPKAIDLDVNGRIIKGIYELDGDTLRMCYNLTSDERPAAFESKPDSGLIVIVHKREK